MPIKYFYTFTQKMRTFALAALAACVSASYGGYGSKQTTRQVNYGTTGHYGNQYGHGGNEDHDHHDHNYGYDSIPTSKALKTGGAGAARNLAIATSIKTAIDLAHTERLGYLRDVRGRKENRLNEIKTINDLEINAPWNY